MDTTTYPRYTQDQKDRLGRRGYALLEMEQANQDPLSHGMEESSSSSRVGEGRPGLQEERSTTGRKKRGGAGTTNGPLVWLQGDATPGPHLPCALFAYLSFQLALLYCIRSMNFSQINMTKILLHVSTLQERRADHYSFPNKHHPPISWPQARSVRLACQPTSQQYCSLMLNQHQPTTIRQLAVLSSYNKSAPTTSQANTAKQTHHARTHPVK